MIITSQRTLLFPGGGGNPAIPHPVWLYTFPLQSRNKREILGNTLNSLSLFFHMKFIRRHFKVTRPTQRRSQPRPGRKCLDLPLFIPNIFFDERLFLPPVNLIT